MNYITGRVRVTIPVPPPPQIDELHLIIITHGRIVAVVDRANVSGNSTFLAHFLQIFAWDRNFEHSYVFTHQIAILIITWLTFRCFVVLIIIDHSLTIFYLVRFYELSCVYR